MSIIETILSKIGSNKDNFKWKSVEKVNNILEKLINSEIDNLSVKNSVIRDIVRF